MYGALWNINRSIKHTKQEEAFGGEVGTPEYTLYITSDVSYRDFNRHEEGLTVENAGESLILVVEPAKPGAGEISPARMPRFMFLAASRLLETYPVHILETSNPNQLKLND